MTPHDTELGFKVNRNRYGLIPTILGMPYSRKLRDILRVNVQALLVHRGAGKDSASALRSVTGIGSAAQTLLAMDGDADPRLSTVEKIAAGFRVKDAWQLLDPTFKPPITSDDLASVDAAREAIRVLTPVQAAELLKSDEVQKILTSREGVSLEKEPR